MKRSSRLGIKLIGWLVLWPVLALTIPFATESWLPRPATTSLFAFALVFPLIMVGITIKQIKTEGRNLRKGITTPVEKKEDFDDRRRLWVSSIAWIIILIGANATFQAMKPGLMDSIASSSGPGLAALVAGFAPVVLTFVPLLFIFSNVKTYRMKRRKDPNLLP